MLYKLHYEVMLIIVLRLDFANQTAASCQFLGPKDTKHCDMGFVSLNIQGSAK